MSGQIEKADVPANTTKADRLGGDKRKMQGGLIVSRTKAEGEPSRHIASDVLRRGSAEFPVENLGHDLSHTEVNFHGREL
ncbi:hypothetical protein Q1695_002850 [Nippostrongylus brasiliensis]|nr:hypothetical protein Q1695_002850 [Nippostrongylus brasiliensis]